MTDDVTYPDPRRPRRPHSLASTLGHAWASWTAIAPCPQVRAGAARIPSPPRPALMGAEHAQLWQDLRDDLPFRRSWQRFVRYVALAAD